MKKIRQIITVLFAVLTIATIIPVNTVTVNAATNAVKMPTKTKEAYASELIIKNENKINIKCDGKKIIGSFNKGKNKWGSFWVTLENENRTNRFAEFMGSFDNSGKGKYELKTSGIKDGTYTLWIWTKESSGYAGSYQGAFNYEIVIKSGKPKFYAPAGKSEEQFIEYVTQKYKPKKIELPWYLKEDAKNSTIKNKTKKIISGCKTNEEKVAAINKWLTKNVEYDYDSLYSGNLRDAADPIKVYKNGKAVCSGYARLARIMFYHAGVPCLNVTGKAYNGSDGKLPTNKSYSSLGTDHEWNLVYVGGKWKILDITWNDTVGSDAYYEILPFAFGNDHVSMSVE